MTKQKLKNDSNNFETLANNCRTLTPAELKFMNDKYLFWVDDDCVCVKCTNRARITRHSIHSKFAINVKLHRKLTYSVDAIQMFIDFQKNDKLKRYSLTSIQNAINICRLSYQPLTTTKIIDILNK